MISILIPSRGRPENMKRVVESAYNTATEKPEFVFYLDNDDIPSQEMARELGVKHIVGERIVLSQMWNEAYKLSTGNILMHGGDDIIFRTDKWDEIVENAFKEYRDEILFAYGRDGYSPDTFGTHGFISRTWVEVVGHFVPPYFSSDYNDTWLNEVAEKIGRHKFLPNVYTEHMHPINGKAEWDITHQERLERHGKDNVDNLYWELKEARDEDIYRLQRYIKSPQPIKYDRYYFLGRQTIENKEHRFKQPHQAEIDAFNYAIKYSKCKNVIDVGAGLGYLSKMFQEQGIKVTGLDPHSRKLFKQTTKAPFISGNLDSLTGDYDTVIFCESIEHITEEEWERNEQKLVDMLCRNNGVLIITNNIENHPIYPDNTGFDHVRTVDDRFYDHLSGFGKVLLRNGSHLVIKFRRQK